MLVSKCCKSYLVIEGHTTHYYCCLQCGMATDAIEQKGNPNAIERRPEETQMPNCS